MCPIKVFFDLQSMFFPVPQRTAYVLTLLLHEHMFVMPYKSIVELLDLMARRRACARGILSHVETQAVYFPSNVFCNSHCSCLESMCVLFM